MSEDERAKSLWMMKTTRNVKAPLLVWLAVHGNLCLSLRHPQNRGPSRKLILDFVKNIGRFLVEAGAVTEAELRAAENLEIEEGSTDIRQS